MLLTPYLYPRFTVAKILRVLKLLTIGARYCLCFTVAKILRVLKQNRYCRINLPSFTVAKILRVLKLVALVLLCRSVLQ